MAKKDKAAVAEEEKDKAAAPDAAAATPAEGEEGAEGAAPKKSKKKLFIIIGAVVGLLVIGGAAAFFMGVFGGGGEAHEEKAAKPEEIVYYNMPEMIINLAAVGKSASFLKATVILELPNKLDAITVEANLPRLMDAFNTYVRELRPSDLSGSAGITRLREELLLRANKALDPLKVNDVLFKEIVVQ